jgi:hypothetical protein
MCTCGEATEVLWDYFMDHVSAPVRHRGTAQLLDAPGETCIQNHHHLGPVHRHTTRIPERLCLWGSPWSSGGPLQKQATCRLVSQSAISKDSECREILKIICHSSQTAPIAALPEDHIRREAGKAVADTVQDPAWNSICCWEDWRLNRSCLIACSNWWRHRLRRSYYILPAPNFFLQAPPWNGLPSRTPFLPCILL